MAMDPEQSWLADRLAHHRALIQDAIHDLNRAAEQHPSPRDHQVIIKVLNDLVRGSEPAPPDKTPRVVSQVLQSRCAHCEERTGSRTAKLCTSCRTALRGASV